MALMALRLLLHRNQFYTPQITDLACSVLKDELDENCIWQAAILLEMCGRHRPEIVCNLAAELCEREHEEARVALGTTVLEYLVNLPGNLYGAKLHNLSQTRPGLREALRYCWTFGQTAEDGSEVQPSG